MNKSLLVLMFVLAIEVADLGVNTALAQSGNYNGYWQNEGWYGQVMQSNWGPPGVYTNVPYSQYNTNYNSRYSGYGNGAYGYGTTNPYSNSYYSGYGYGGTGNLPTTNSYDSTDPSFGNNGYDGTSYRYYRKGSPYSRF
jgi:hypothetical protein